MTAITDAMEAVAEKLRAAGIDATTDPRSAVPPCVLVEIPNLRFDVGCGATGEWSVVALAAGPANLDAAEQLTTMSAACAGVLPLERGDRVQYQLSPNNQPLYGFRMIFTQGVDL